MCKGYVLEVVVDVLMRKFAMFPVKGKEQPRVLDIYTVLHSVDTCFSAHWEVQLVTGCGEGL